MNQLAKAAGVSVSTVSRALRSQPSIPEETRKRIQQLADKFGYRPDPMLDALSAYRRGISKKEYRATLALIATSEEWRQDLGCRLYFEGAQRRAENLGYQIEVFVVTANHLRCERLMGILEARGIRGVMTLPIQDVAVDLELLPQKFQVVALGYKFTSPLVNRVSISHFSAMGQALEKLHGLGYRRPALVLRAESTRKAPGGMTHVGKLWKGGYLAECARQFPDLRVPVIQAADSKQFGRWLKRYSPDALISQDRAIGRFMRDGPSRIPIAYTMVDDDPALTGIHQNSWQVGRRAVDLLVADLYRSDADPVVAPVTVLVGTGWQEGSTVAARQPPRSEA